MRRVRERQKVDAAYCGASSSTTAVAEPEEVQFSDETPASTDNEWKCKSHVSFVNDINLYIIHI